MREYFLVLGLLVYGPVGIGSDDTSVSDATLARQDADAPPVRIDTSVGAFLVREGWAEEFRQVLTGEPTEHRFYAGDLIQSAPDRSGQAP